MKKVCFIKSMAAIGYAYVFSDVCELADDLADKFILWKYAVEVPKKFEILPNDFPERNSFISAGLCSLEDLEKLPPYHKLGGNAKYSLNIPLTREILAEYKKRKSAIVKPKRNIIY